MSEAGTKERMAQLARLVCNPPTPPRCHREAWELDHEMREIGTTTERQERYERTH